VKAFEVAMWASSGTGYESLPTSSDLPRYWSYERLVARKSATSWEPGTSYLAIA